MSDFISIIVPVYNTADFLPRCLDSIINQTYKNIEVIAVDDGSSDNSLEVLYKYAKQYPQIRVIHQENAGVTVARIRGINEANGAWIGFVDSDDYIEPDMYFVLLNNALLHNADISHCGYRMVFNDGRVNFFYNTNQTIVQDNEKGIIDLLEGTMVEPGLCNKLFRKDLLHKAVNNSNFDKSIKINEDLLLNFFIFNHSHKSVFLDICPYHYIVRNNSASRQKLNINKIFDPIRVRELILSNCNEHIHISPVAKKSYINSCLYACHSILVYDKKKFSTEFDEVRRKLKSSKTEFSLIGTKHKYMAYGVLYFPVLYRIFYNFFKNFRNKKYD